MTATITLVNSYCNTCFEVNVMMFTPPCSINSVKQVDGTRILYKWFFNGTNAQHNITIVINKIPRYQYFRDILLK